MRILFINEICTRGGVSVVLRNRLDILKKKFPKIKADILFLIDDGGRDIFKDTEENLFILNKKISIEKFISDREYDVIFNIDNSPMYEIIGELDQKVVLEFHNPYDGALSYLNVCYNKLINKKNVIAFTVPSKYFKKLVLKEFGNQLNVYVFPNFIGDSFISDSIDQRLKMVSGQKKTIGWAGRLDYLKDWKEFIKISSGLIEKRDDIEFLIIGGYGAPESEKNELFNYLKRYHLLPHTRWVPSIMYMSLFYKYLAESKGCFISTSNNESFGMTILESMICKCPVVGPDIGAFQELFDEGRRGNLYKKGDIKSGIQEINSILDDSSQRNKLVNNAYKAAWEVYDPYRIMSDWISFINKNICT